MCNIRQDLPETADPGRNMHKKPLKTRQKKYILRLELSVFIRYNSECCDMRAGIREVAA